MLKIKDLKVTFGNTVALDIKGTLDIKKGERIGIIGSNGAGKSTLVNSIIGNVRYKGKIDSEVSYSEIAVHLQSNGYNKIVKVKTIIEAIIGDNINNNDKLNELIDYFEFRHCLNKKFNNLSGGEKQKLTIILIIMQNAPLTIFDEVTSGLDFISRKNLMMKLNDIYSKDGENKDKTVLLISHYYQELENLVDSLIILDKGHVIEKGKVKELFKKYCGDHVVITSLNENTLKITENHKRISGPEDKIVLSFNNLNDSDDVLNNLKKANEEFTVTSKDIEILSINAKEYYYKGGKYEKI